MLPGRSTGTAQPSRPALRSSPETARLTEQLKVQTNSLRSGNKLVSALAAASPCSALPVPWETPNSLRPPQSLQPKTQSPRVAHGWLRRGLKPGTSTNGNHPRPCSVSSGPSPAITSAAFAGPRLAAALLFNMLAHFLSSAVGFYFFQ